MKLTERIVEYIKSWFYYPTMEKYFDGLGIPDANVWKCEKFARFKYAWWKSHVGRLK